MNRHSLRHQHLKLACLPIPPPRHIEGWIWLNYIFSPTYAFEMWIYEFIPWQPSFPPLGDLLSIYPYLQYVKERIRLSSLDFKDTIIFSFFKKNCIFFFVPRVGFEPTTHRLEICCSIQLSYRGIYVFLIKYNKKIKNCFFLKNSRVSHDFKDTILFWDFQFFLNFFIGYSKYNKTESIFQWTFEIFCVSHDFKDTILFWDFQFFLNFFYFFPVTYCFYGTSVYVTFVTFRTNIWRKLMNNVFLTV